MTVWLYARTLLEQFLYVVTRRVLAFVFPNHALTFFVEDLNASSSNKEQSKESNSLQSLVPIWSLVIEMFCSKQLLIVVLIAVVEHAQACTVFIVGKDATVDGSVLVTHSNDGEFETDPRLVSVPAMDYPEGSLRPVYFSPENYPRYVGTARNVPEYYPKGDETPFEPIGHIPQVPHTFSYL